MCTCMQITMLGMSLRFWACKQVLSSMYFLLSLSLSCEEIIFKTFVWTFYAPCMCCNATSTLNVIVSSCFVLLLKISKLLTCTETMMGNVSQSFGVHKQVVVLVYFLTPSLLYCNVYIFYVTLGSEDDRIIISGCFGVCILPNTIHVVL